MRLFGKNEEFGLLQKMKDSVKQLAAGGRGVDLLKDSFNKNLYDYVHNQAIHFTDQRGLRLFCCPKGYSAADEAARNAIATWNPTSIRENREHGGYVCECRAWFGLSKVVYYYTHAVGDVEDQIRGRQVHRLLSSTRFFAFVSQRAVVG